MTPRAPFPLALLLVALASAPALAGTRVDLDGPWQFRVDDGSADAAGWARAVPAGVETVDVPHTWGVGPHAEHEGVAWYWKTLDVPPALRGRPLELHFGGDVLQCPRLRERPAGGRARGRTHRLVRRRD